MKPVELLAAHSTAIRGKTSQGVLVTSYSVKFSAVVQNLGYAKRVSIWGHDINSNTWRSYSCRYTGSVAPNGETWEASVASAIDRFDVRYDVGGQTYWDNNAGADYRLDPVAASGSVPIGSAAIARNVVVLEHRTSAGTLSVDVLVKNDASAKQVIAIYTQDRWLSVNRVGGLFRATLPPPGLPSQPNAELWTVSAPVRVPTDVHGSQFAVSCTAGGNTSWDNNFGRNFVF